MRKIISFLMLFCVATGMAWAQDVVYQKIPHTQWTVSAFNETVESGNEGGVSFIKDDNPNTFYHSDWTSSYSDQQSGMKGQDGLQGFMVELPEVYTFNQITYAGRSDNGNNWATTVRIYVYETLPDGFPETLSSLTRAEKEALLSKDGTILGTPCYDNSDNPWAADRNVKTAEFTATGKYILFVADETTHTNGYLTCSDFQVYQAIEGIKQHTAYYLKIKSLTDADYYLDTKTGESSNYGYTISKTTTPVATYFSLEDGVWTMRSGVLDNYVGVTFWDACVGNSSGAKWTLHEVEDGAYVIAQDTYYGDNGIEYHYLGANGGDIAGQSKVYTDKTKDQAVVIEFVEAPEEVQQSALESGIEILNKYISEVEGSQRFLFLSEETKAEWNSAKTISDATTLDKVLSLNNELPTIVSRWAGTEVGGFSNNAVYTFISKRSDTAYMMYDGTNDFVASPWMQTTLEASADNVNCQWAVYQSEKGNYYLYNIGAGKFMGKETAANTGIPFTATPATTDLKLKISGVATHPIMISSDNGGGAVNQSNNTGFTNNNGVINWSGGWGYTEDLGNVHAVVKVADIDATVLATIETAVNTFESRDLAITALEEAIAAAQTKVNTIGTAIGYYTCSNANAVAELATIKAWFETITDATTLEEIEAKTEEVNAITNATYTLNTPEIGKFYRLKNVASGRYMSAGASSVTMLDDGGSAVSTIFYLDENNKLLSYTEGRYLDCSAKKLSAVGTSHSGAFYPAHNGVTENVVMYKNNGYYTFGNKDNGVSIDRGYNHPTGADYDWTFVEVEWLPVAMNETAGYATLNSPVALSTYVGGSTTEHRVMAYTGEIEDDYLTLTRIDAEDGIIPANTPVVLEYVQDVENGYVFLEVKDSEKEAVESSLQGTLAAATCEANANYSLAFVNEEIGFYSYAGTTLKGFKAFLPKSTTSATNALRIRKGETTAIENVQTEIENGAIYDLSGRRVQKMVKGLYIVNGKKVIKK